MDILITSSVIHERKRERERERGTWMGEWKEKERRKWIPTCIPFSKCNSIPIIPVSWEYLDHESRAETEVEIRDGTSDWYYEEQWYISNAVPNYGKNIGKKAGSKKKRMIMMNGVCVFVNSIKRILGIHVPILLYVSILCVMWVFLVCTYYDLTPDRSWEDHDHLSSTHTQWDLPPRWSETKKCYFESDNFFLSRHQAGQSSAMSNNPTAFVGFPHLPSKRTNSKLSIRVSYYFLIYTVCIRLLSVHWTSSCVSLFHCVCTRNSIPFLFGLARLSFFVVVLINSAKVR